MRILIQRVTQAAVHVEGQAVGAIGPGLLLLVGIAQGDTRAVAEAMCRKVTNLRVFADADDKSHFDRTALDVGAEILAVSQFALYADCRKGRRPSFASAAEPRRAEEMIEYFVAQLRQYPLKVETGRFGAMMQVSLVNDGPVSIWLDSNEVLPGVGGGHERTL